MFRHSRGGRYHQMLSSPSKLKAARHWQRSRSVFFSSLCSFLPGLRCALWGSLAAAVLLFWSITFVRPIGWYRDDQGGHFKVIWDTLELRSTATKGSGNKLIMQGMISTQVRQLCTHYTSRMLHTADDHRNCLPNKLYPLSMPSAIACMQ